MSLTDNTDVVLRYLLGDVSDQEKNWIEAQMLTDEDFLEHSMILEDQLVDDYILGHLGERHRILFDKKFHDSPRIQTKLSLARALVENARRTAAVRPLSDKESLSPRFTLRGLLSPQATWQSAVSLISVTALLFLGIWATQWRQETARLRDELAAEQRAELGLLQQLEEQTGRQAQMVRQLDQERTLYDDAQAQLHNLKIASSTITSLTLFPGGFRAGDTQLQEAILTPKSTLLHLALMVEPGMPFQQYRVQLQDRTGTPLLTMSDLHLKLAKTPQGQFLAVSLPPKALTNADYIIVLEAKDSSGNYELVGSYNFRVTKKAR